MDRVQEKKAGLRGLTEAIDTTTPAGRIIMQMVASFAEFERAMLKERTKIGLDAARKDGRVAQARIGGRKPKLKPQQQQEILQLVPKGEENRGGCSPAIRSASGNGYAVTTAKARCLTECSR